ncbi:hypothetical protein C8R43DRAFT_1136479 [Mycena crocata]|nr:hypothetical protein C8R43DRAFT_1136479 [Mycena crocata]
MSRSKPLVPTNITQEEMIPDQDNPAHDSRYWCLPPRRDREALPQQGGRYPMYLVTQGRICGIWKSWLITKSMVDGYPAGAQRGHQSVEACIDEWQLGCSLGLHPHPVDPAIINSSRFPAAPVQAHAASPSGTPPHSPSPSSSPPSSPSSPCLAPRASQASAAEISPFSPPRERARPIDAGLQEQMLKYCVPNGLGVSESPAAVESSSSTLSTVSSLAASSAIQEGARYYAIWGEHIVYSNGRQAKHGFLAAEAEGKSPRLLSTENYDEALAFSEAIHWVSD